ncbi:MAG: DUF3843 family protein [Flavobacteriaceae bacterium]|nr:DUF3843 family protein [Flavobacteriaceae bacterium]
MKKPRIYINDWLTLKPYTTEGQPDLYYLKICNEVYKNIDDSIKFLLYNYIEEKDIKILCCFLVSYFEDIISETNIWFSFKSKYKELYNKTLPLFVTEDDYYDDEINHEDIALLVWYFINSIQQDSFISPYNDFIQDIAHTTMQVLEEEYDYAPENKKLKARYILNPKKSSFYEAREFIQTVYFGSYLFYPDITFQEQLESIEIIEENKNEDPQLIESYLRELHETFTFSKRSSLLALKGQDWAGLILGKSHPLYQNIITLSEKITGLFLYKQQNKTSVFLEHIASGMPFEMCKESFDYYNELNNDDILFIGLIKWDNQWWFSGTYVKQEFDADLILDQKNSPDARAKVNFLEDKNTVNTILKTKEDLFLEYNKGSHVAFMETKKINIFVGSFLKHYNSSLGLSKQESDAAKKRARQDGYFGEDDTTINVFDSQENENEEAVIFYNPNVGIEIYFDIINAFPDKNNPFFTEIFRDDIIRLLASPDYPIELVHYFLKHYKSKIKLLKEQPFVNYLENLDFLLRFWKKDNYISKSSIIFTGKP